MNFGDIATSATPQRQPAEIAARLLVSLPVFARSNATELSLAWAQSQQVPWRTVISAPVGDPFEQVEGIETVDAINTHEPALALCFSSPAALSDALMRVMFSASETSEPSADQAEFETESDAVRCAQFLKGVEVLE
jgi:hypothetical protein